MYYTKQEDYDNFKCIGGSCPKTCCSGWLIEIDKDSLAKYRNNNSEFASRLIEGIDWNDGTFRLSGKRCCMLNADNLCDMQIALGEEALCYTCRMYPRHVEEYEDLRELSLSLSCPEVARMVCNRQAPYTFIESEDDTPENYDDYEDFDFLLHSALEYSREKLYSLLTNRELNIWCRMANVLSLCHEIQKLIDKNMIADIETAVDEFDADNNIDIRKWLNVSPAVLSTLESLDNAWPVYVRNLNAYYQNADFSSLTTQVTMQERLVLEHISVLLIYSFFCGAVYDDEVYSKAALCIISTWWIYISYRYLSEKEDITALEKAIYDYASEIEHSDNNLIALEKYLKELQFSK